MANRDEIRNKTVLAVYCRDPETDSVKTRLAKGVGSSAARLFYSGCLASLRCDLNILRRDFSIAICPSEEKAADWAKGYFPMNDHVCPQIHGDLGRRLEHTDLILRDQGYEKVIFIGSDAPSLPVEYIKASASILNNLDVALGPCYDGGVYVIGSRIAFLTLREIQWGTSTVFASLMLRYKQEGITAGLLPIWYDVDRVGDLSRVHQDLIRSSQRHRQVLGRLTGEIITSFSSSGRKISSNSAADTCHSSYKKNGGRL